LAAAEGPAPLIANRLWDASHVNDKSQVIASSSGDKQSFQIVNMDVRFVYRIGLTDQAAGRHLQQCGCADPDPQHRQPHSRTRLCLAHPRRTAGRTTHRPGRRDRPRRAGRPAKLDSGVEILATVVEAIHHRPAPPMPITACRPRRSARRP
jgi:hypothetical protein